jgi:hypothetical protein
MKLGTGQSSRSSGFWDVPSDKRKCQKVKLVTVLSQELLWLWDGVSSGTHERERPPSEAGT